jgi:cation:H+ antiporter
MILIGNAFIFVIGLIVLIFSADILIQGCVKISFLFKLSPLFVGLILVAFGTSAPEAGIGIIAAIKNQKGIALGNIVGSNIANIGLILGLCSIFTPLKVNKSIFRRELPIMIASGILLYLLSLDLVISRLDGFIFLLFFIGFCIFSYQGARHSFQYKEVEDFQFKKWFRRISSSFVVWIITLISLGGVIWGADLMVRGGVNLAKFFGISTWVIGLTVFAIGTSLPELVASLTASFKKVPSISIGNIVGSNIFNVLFVLGIVSLIRPIEITSSVLKFEFPVMIVFSLILFVIMRTKYKITRVEGTFLFLFYLSFLYFLFRR